MILKVLTLDMLRPVAALLMGDDLKIPSFLSSIIYFKTKNPLSIATMLLVFLKYSVIYRTNPTIFLSSVYAFVGAC